MSNGKTNRNRGFGFERELVNWFRSQGITAERAWGSNGKSIGCAETVDLVANGCRIQAKRKKTLPAYLQIPEGADCVITRQDRGPTMVLLPLATFTEMINDGF